MSIQFNCVKCGRLLQVPDGSDGKLARCQICGEQMTIPSAATAPAAHSPPSLQTPAPQSLQTPAPQSLQTPTAWPLQPPDPPQTPDWHGVKSFDSQNPYQAPSTYPDQPAGFTNSGLPTAPIRISVWDAFNDGAYLYKRHAGSVLLAQFIANVIVIGVIAVLGFGIGISSLDLREIDNNPAIVLLAELVVGILFSWLYLGQLLYYAKLARGEKASVADLMSGGPYLLSFLGASFLCFLGAGLGYILCIIPGLMVYFALGSYAYFIVDRKFRAVDSLKASRFYTAGNRWSLFGIQFLGAIFSWIIMVGMVLISILIHPSVLAVAQLALYFFWIPFMILANLSAYLRMTGQGVARYGEGL